MLLYFYLIGNDDWVQAPVIPAKAGIQRIVAKYDLPELIEMLPLLLLENT